MLRNGKRLAICMKEKGILEYLRICSHIRIITVGGTGNYVIIGRNVKLTNITVAVTGNNNKIFINDNCELKNCTLRTDGDNNVIYIGNGTYIGGAVIHAMSSTSISIGKKCMFSSEIDIRSGEHCIYNITDKKQYNFAKDIKIGEHVWIGKRVQCLKGVEVARDSIIGASSLVTKKFKEPNVIIAGNPAKVIRRGINWKR